MFKRLVVLLVLVAATVAVSTSAQAASAPDISLSATSSPVKAQRWCAQAVRGAERTDGVDALAFIEYFYYSDATYTVQVGYRYWDQCLGWRHSEGTQTSYFIRRAETCSCPYC